MLMFILHIDVINTETDNVVNIIDVKTNFKQFQFFNSFPSHALHDLINCYPTKNGNNPNNSIT